MSNTTTTTRAGAGQNSAQEQPDVIIALPGIERAMTGVSMFRFPADARYLSAQYTDGTVEQCVPKHETRILLLAIASCVRQDKALPDFNSFSLVSEVQSHRR